MIVTLFRKSKEKNDSQLATEHGEQVPHAVIILVFFVHQDPRGLIVYFFPSLLEPVSPRSGNRVRTTGEFFSFICRWREQMR